VLTALEWLCRSQNDNLGRDLARFANEVVFMGHRFEAVSYLDNNPVTTTRRYPVFGVNWGQVQIYTLSGMSNVESGVMRAPNMHNVWVNFFDSVFQIVMLDPRTCFRLDLHTDETTPTAA